MKLDCAVVTAAGKGQRDLPLQTLVDRDGHTRSALAIIAREIVDAGIKEIAVIVQPGEGASYAGAAGEMADVLTFIEQHEPRGYGHALACARGFTGDRPFLHLVSDHLAVSETQRGCARQLVEAAEAESCAISAVQPTHESALRLYGAVGGLLVPGKEGLYKVDRVIEKPSPTQAEQELVVPGLRNGHYLCFFGMHVLTPGVMEILGEMLNAASPDERVQLSPALHVLAGREKYLALGIHGNRHNIGVRYGLFHAQLALALHGCDRDEVLTQIVRMLGSR